MSTPLASGYHGEERDLYIVQGEDVQIDLVAVDASGDVVDITGATIAASIRDTHGGTVIGTLTGTVLVGTSGTYRLSQARATTADWSFTRGVWDAYREAGGVRKPLAFGRVFVRPRVAE